MTRIVFLDDYQAATALLAPLDKLSWAEVDVLREHLSHEELKVALADADVVVAMRERTRFDRGLLAGLPKLRLICTTGPRNAAIDVVCASEHGVTVSATDDHPSENTAELAWGLILAAARNIPCEVASVRSGGWQASVGLELRGLTLGVIGLGRIGSKVARVAHAFEMEVVAWSEHLTEVRSAAVGARLVPKEQLFSLSDIVTIHLVLSDRSRGLVGPAELSLMKQTSILVNTSRGPVVDEAALVAALEDGRIGGAAVDVFNTEPLSADHPFRTMPNVIATPHIGFVTTQTLRSWYADVAENILAWRDGHPIRVIQA